MVQWNLSSDIVKKIIRDWTYIKSLKIKKIIIICYYCYYYAWNLSSVNCIELNESKANLY